MIHDLRPYPAMKDSGVPWLGQVPEHWEVKRGKNFFRVVDVRSKKGNEELLTVSSERGVVPRSSANVTMFKAESYIGHKLCWPDDLVINSLWAWSRGLGVSKHHGIISTAYSVYRLRDAQQVLPEYINNLTRSSPFQWELQVRSKGIWISRLQLTDDSFLNAPFPLPSPAEQAAIVRFLDHADRRIRKAIAAKQKLIKLLQEQKQVIINQAVTRGLDPNVKLKPSGVEWLGDVPEHWSRTRLKFEAIKLVDCLHATPPYSDDGEYPAIRTADIEPGKVRLNQTKRLTQTHYNLWTSRYRPKAGDILYSREGERFGIAAVVPDDIQLCISQRMMVFNIKPAVYSQYLMWQLNCRHVYLQAALDTIGSAAPHVNVERIKNFLIVLPPFNEQAEICFWLECELKNLDQAIARAQAEISLLREYRTRLIADVVTGKLDVREAAARLPEPEAEALPEELDAGEEEGLESDEDSGGEGGEG